MLSRFGFCGLDGLVAFWADHGELTERLIDLLPSPTLVVPGPAEDRSATRDALSRFLSIPMRLKSSAAPATSTSSAPMASLAWFRKMRFFES